MEEDDAPGVLARADAVVVGARRARRKLGELVVMRCEERTALRDVVQVLGDGQAARHCADVVHLREACCCDRVVEPGLAELTEGLNDHVEVAETFAHVGDQRSVAGGVLGVEHDELDLGITERPIDTCGLLGLLGGLSAKLPADWTMRLKSAERLGTGEVNHPLGPLAAPTVLKMLAASGSGGFSIITLDPAGRGRKSPGPVIRTFPFTLSRGEDAGWRVDLPVMEADEEPAAEDAGEFTALWALAHPPVAQPDAGQAKSAFLKALGTQTAEAALAISQPGNCLAAAQVWWDIHDPAAARHALPLAFQEDGDAAVCLLQFFSTREPEILDARPFYFEKTAAGWWWSPAPGETLRERFQPWVETETQRQSGEWQQALLADSPVLPTLKAAAPSEAEARRAVESWLDAARAADVPAALACTARLGEAGSAPTLLRNLGYEIAGFRTDGEEPAIIGIHQGKTWSVVVVRAVRDGGTSHPIYPVVRTAVGPRILAEIDLSAAGSRSREFLNKVALDRLEKAGFVAAAEELAELLTACRADAVKQSGEVTK